MVSHLYTMSGPFRFLKRMSGKSKGKKEPERDLGREEQDLSSPSTSAETITVVQKRRTGTTTATTTEQKSTKLRSEPKPQTKPEAKGHSKIETNPDPDPETDPANHTETQSNMDGQSSVVVDREMSRMRTELSRASFTCERREMEAARADADLRHYQGDLARMTALKSECDHENRKLQAEVASLEREKARLAAETERLKEDTQRATAKLADKKRLTTELKAQLKVAEEARDQMERTAREREQTWHTIRRDVTAKRDDAIRDSCKVRRENEKLKLKIKKLKMEKSNILIRVWEKKQLQAETSATLKTSATHTRVYNDIRGDLHSSKSHRGPEDESLQAKILSLELQLFRQARLVELLLDVIQAQDPQFTAEERTNLTSAFADAGSIPEMLSRKLKFS